jgi:hypothetical protein
MCEVGLVSNYHGKGPGRDVVQRTKHSLGWSVCEPKETVRPRLQIFFGVSSWTMVNGQRQPSTPIIVLLTVTPTSTTKMIKISPFCAATSAVAMFLLLSSLLEFSSLTYGMQIEKKTTNQNHHHASKTSSVHKDSKIAICPNGRRDFFENIIKTTSKATAASMILLTGLLDPNSSVAADPMQPSAASPGKIASRLQSTALVLPQPSYASELNGIDNTYYPDWLDGYWDVTQTLVDAQTPLGLKFVGGPNGQVDIAEKSMTEAKSKVSC